MYRNFINKRKFQEADRPTPPEPTDIYVNSQEPYTGEIPPTPTPAIPSADPSLIEKAFRDKGIEEQPIAKMIISSEDPTLEGVAEPTLNDKDDFVITTNTVSESAQKDPYVQAFLANEEGTSPSVTGAGSSATTDNKDVSIESLSSLTKVPLTAEERKKAQGILQGLQEKFPNVYGPRQKRLTRLLEDDNILMYPRMYNRKIGDRLAEPLSALRQQRRDKILQTLASPELGAIGQAMSMVTDLPERSFARAGYNMERGPKGKLRAIGNIAEGATSILGSMLSGFGPVGSSRGLRNLFSTDDGEEVTTSSGDTYRLVQQDDGSYEAVIVPQSKLSTDRSEFFGEDGTLKEGYTRKYNEDGLADGFIYDSEGNRVYREMFINQAGGSTPVAKHQNVMTAPIFVPSLPTVDISTPFPFINQNPLGDTTPLTTDAPFDMTMTNVMGTENPNLFSQPGDNPFAPTGTYNPYTGETTVADMVDKDGEGIPDTVDVDAGTGTNQPLEGVTPFSYQETTETDPEKTEQDFNYLEMARRLGFLGNVMQPNDITTAAAKTGMALFDTVSGGNPALGLGTAAAGLGKIGLASAREMKGARAEAIATADARRRAAEKIRRGVMEGGDKGRQDIALENYLATGAYDPMATEFGQDGLMVGYSEGGLNVSNRGLLAYPDGVVVPSGNITMKLDGLPSSVLAIPENDPITIMQNGNDYVFRNSNYVVEIPLNEALYG